MDSTTLNENQIDLDRSMASPTDDQDLDLYRYETFRAALLLNDARFSSNSLKPGQVLPDQTLVRSNSEPISLRQLAKGRPIVLVTGSLTCPLTISALPLFGELNRLYGDRVAFAFRALFAGDNAVEEAISAIAKEGQPHKSQAFGRLAAPMKSIGYIEETLRRAGSQAYRDVIKAVPPMW